MFKKIFCIFCVFFFNSCGADSSYDRVNLQSQASSQESLRSVSQNSSSSQSNKKFKILFQEKQNSNPFKVEVLAEDLGVPWGMQLLNEKDLIFTEREGLIKKLHIPTGVITDITGGPEVYARGQGGLLDIALHPEFEKNKWVYITYSIEKKGGQSTALARGVLSGNSIKNLQILFIAQPFYSSRIHFGSRLAFDEKGFLFMSVGERGQQEEAQNLGSHLGKLLRLTEEGKAPQDNPFVQTEGALAEIWTYGHRNPQGLYIHPETKNIFLQEHGPKGGDEINLIQKGKNYGWPVITYGRSYVGFKIGEGKEKQGMEQPVKYWTPSIAPSGLMIYSGKKFPEWKGDFFSGALVLTHLNKLKIKQGKIVDEKRFLPSLHLRFRHIIEGPEGFIYASVDQGMILKISPL